ncbi:MAG: tRNA lysidine(34) synthetase TilS [Pseudorhodobacter sp.]
MTLEIRLFSLMRAAFRPDEPTRIGVAVSGGGDSLALLHLLARLAPEEGWQIQAATVDHALRPESAAEARQVAEICAHLGIRHKVLRWDHGPVSGNLQDAARRARYRLLGDWAAGEDISHVALAHTADDQAETFLMGLSRVAGLDGLVGMRPCWAHGQVRFVRPLLGARRAELRDYLKDRRIGWIDDPSNDDPRYARVRARRALAELASLGISAGTLEGVMSNLRQVQQMLQQLAEDLARRIASEIGGMVLIDRAAWQEQPLELRRRLMIAALLSVSGAEYPPRAAAIRRLLAVVAAGRTATLWGCHIQVTTSEIRVLREERAVRRARVPPGRPWDCRWHVDGPFERGMEIRALGAEGLKYCPDWRETGLPRAALLVSPAVWGQDRLVSAPLAGFSHGFSARIDAAFMLSSVLH